MAAIALMILVSSFLATGATRVEVYRSHVGRVGGRVATACFIFLTYILLLAWILVLFCCIIVTTFYSLSWGEFYYIAENYNQCKDIYNSTKGGTHPNLIDYLPELYILCLLDRTVDKLSI